MEDKIKKVLDSLDYNEAESLIGDMDVSESPDSTDKTFNYSKIENMVYEKTGVRKIRRFRINKYMVAAAACIIFMVGTVAVAARTFLIGNLEKDCSDIAMIDDYESAYDDGLWSVEIIDGGTASESESIANGKDDKENKGSDKPKNNKTDKPAGQPSNNDVASGNEADEYESMPSKDVDKLISDSTSEIDMDGFVVKYKSVDEMIEDSDYVVRGVKTQSILESSEDKDVYNLVAEFKVKSLLVDNIGDDIKDKILVNEGIRYNSKEEKVIHVGGYKSMINKKEYILFLKNTSEGNLRIAGLVYGKIPVDSNEYAIYIDDAYSKNDYIVKLTNMIDDARKRFLSEEDEINNDVTAPPEKETDDEDEDEFSDEDYETEETESEP